MGETLRVKAGEDAIKRVQQGFDKVKKEKEMNGYVVLTTIMIISGLLLNVGWIVWLGVTQTWPGPSYCELTQTPQFSGTMSSSESCFVN